MSSKLSPDAFTRLKVWLAKRSIGPRVQERILRLNPQPQEGMMLRGWSPTRTARSEAWMRDVCSRPVFEKRWGKGSAGSLPDRVFVSGGGKRRWIVGMAYAQGPQ